MSLELEKREFRRLAKAARIRAAATRGDAAKALARNVRQVLGQPLPRVVSGYLAIDDEIDIGPLMSGLDADGAVNVLPVVVAKDAALVFRHWRPGVPLEVGPWNTQHPGPDSAEAVPDVLLVPMLAFDGDGYRIGWGGGFYDRTIATLRSQRPTLAIGVAYSGQRVDAVPRGDHDQPLDWVVTEEGSLEIGGAE